MDLESLPGEFVEEDGYLTSTLKVVKIRECPERGDYEIIEGGAGHSCKFLFRDEIDAIEHLERVLNE